MFFKSSYFTKILLTSLTLAFLSCDDGRIYEEEYVPDASGKVMKLTAQITGMDSWARGYSLVLAGFDGDDEYAVITKPVPFPKEEGEQVELVMSGIPDNVTTLSLCIVNRQRVRVHSYVDLPCDKNVTDTLRMENVVEDVNMFDVVQQEVFSDDEYTCYRCHSGDKPAAGITLTEGHSYSNLVNHPSGITPDALIVEPGNAAASTLYQMLATDFGEHLKYNHANILINSYTDKSLVKDWINNGAKE